MYIVVKKELRNINDLNNITDKLKVLIDASLAGKNVAKIIILHSCVNA